MILLDTNVLGRMTSKAEPQGVLARHGIQTLFARKERLIIVPQNLYEFWAVATRKRGPPPNGQNGLGMTVKQASLWLRFFQRRFILLNDQKDLVTLWHDLVKSFDIVGARSHDVRLVAAMQSHAIASLFTFNTDHFRRFPITLIDPSSL
jgi:predicted nucleic acid-binding protein